jgi:hypothetical protein
MLTLCRSYSFSRKFTVRAAARVPALMGDVPAETAMELGSVGPTTVVNQQVQQHKKQQ